MRRGGWPQGRGVKELLIVYEVQDYGDLDGLGKMGHSF